ncbi:MAG TPA: organic hydroperoxide resistance protein [Candidatus Saccharimonadia bacterium]|nr:organic hydroperoxide resistance protein [Candidatus Saccharimonadia bacterium]
MQTLYTAQATATGGRDGRVVSSDGVVSHELSMPKSLGGSEKPGTSNPEQLFAAGYAACFAGAVGLVARQQKVAVTTVEVTARVSIGRDAGGLGLAAELDTRLPGVDRATAEKLVEAAHQVCPYSKATRNNIEVKLGVID